MKRLKKDLEKMLATRIVMTIGGETIIEVPLEFFYLFQNFLRGTIPLDICLAETGRKGESIIPSGVKSKIGGSI